MKSLLIGLLMAASFNTFAESYTCEVKINKNDTVINQIKLEHESFSMTGGLLHEYILGQKKNKKGIIIEESKIILTGGFLASYEAEVSKFEGEMLIQNTKNKIKGNKIVNSQVTMLPFVEFKGNGDFMSELPAATLIDGESYTVNVQCSYQK